MHDTQDTEDAQGTQDAQEPHRRIRAAYTDTTITVYQAYAPRLGHPAAGDGRFPPAWKRDRMTWIKRCS